MDGNLAVAAYMWKRRTDFVWNRQECCHSSSKRDWGDADQG